MASAQQALKLDPDCVLAWVVVAWLGWQSVFYSRRERTLEMCQPGHAVDVFRVPGGGGDAGVDRLAELPDHHQIIDQAAAQRPEHITPGCGEGVRAVAEHLGNADPGSVESAVRSAARWTGTQAIAGKTFVPFIFRSGRHRVMIFGELCRANAGTVKRPALPTRVMREQPFRSRG